MSSHANSLSRIVSELGTNFIVNAGAGTGKTYALVSRVVALVQAGVAMKNIVVITFTRAAAGELSERIRVRMEQLLDTHHPDNEGDLLFCRMQSAERERIKTALGQLDQAAIQTIHSFVAQLLRTRPLDIGLPPGWVRDEIEANQRFRDRWNEWLKEALGNKAPAKLQAALRYLLEENIGVNKWRRVAQQFSDNTDRIGDNAIQTIDLHAAAKDVLLQLQELANQCINPAGSDKLYGQLNGAIGTVKEVLQVADSPAVAAEVLRDSEEVDYSRAVGEKNNWQKPLKEIRESFRQIGQSFQQMVRMAPAIPLLLELKEKFVARYSADRKADGVATSNDLLVWGRDLLRDNEEARSYFQTRYSHILIDEFQDTDPLQAEIAFYLAAQPDMDITGTPWYQLRQTPGKLFIVGDPKQSIYRFRRADIEVLQQVQENEGFTSLTLTENRRSSQPILDWVNNTFGSLMQEKPGVQAQYVSLQPSTDTQAKGTVLAFGEKIDASAEDRRRTQAQHVANLIVHAIERLHIYDKGTKRPATPKDICVLIRSRTGLDILERGLEDAHIPYRIEDDNLLFATQEVQDLLNCLRAINDPADEVSVVAALRSPAFACSDIDLLRWRENGGVWNYLDVKTGEGLVWDGLAKLREYREKRKNVRTSELLSELVRERRLQELDLAARRPRENWRRRQFLINQVRNLEARQRGRRAVLPQFIQWAEEMREGNARINDRTIAIETDDDAVRIMTMHAAKGLEFPIVILLGLNQQGNSTSSVLFGKTGVEVKLGKGLTLNYSAIEATEKERTDAERVRLAYVASTRARDHLFISMYSSIDPIKAPPAEVDLEPQRQWNAAPIPTATPGAYDLEGWQKERTAAILRRARPQAITATHLAHPPTQESTLYQQSERDGKAFGSAVHCVLQGVVAQMQLNGELPLPSNCEVSEWIENLSGTIDTLAQEQAANKGVPAERQDDIGGAVRWALQHDAVLAALQAGRQWSEISVAAPYDGVVISGIIDLLYQDIDGQLVILDYKTDSVSSPDEIDDRLQHYQYQGAAYAYAVEKATQMTVKSVRFLFLNSTKDSLRQVNFRPLLAALRERISNAVNVAE